MDKIVLLPTEMAYLSHFSGFGSGQGLKTELGYLLEVLHKNSFLSKTNFFFQNGTEQLISHRVSLLFAREYHAVPLVKGGCKGDISIV